MRCCSTQIRGNFGAECIALIYQKMFVLSAIRTRRAHLNRYTPLLILVHHTSTSVVSHSPLFPTPSQKVTAFASIPATGFTTQFPFSNIVTSAVVAASDHDLESDAFTSDGVNIAIRGLTSVSDDADKIYRLLIDMESHMESTLDQLGVILTTPLVLEVLNRIWSEEKLAFRFFMWAGRQDNYAHEPKAYNTMIDILSSTKYKAKQFRIVCDMLDYMKRNDRKSVPVETLLMMLRTYTESHLTHLQKFVKKKKMRVRTQPEINAFNFLLDALCKCSLVEEADRMLRRLGSKIKPDANTYNILFFGWCRVRNPSRGMTILEEMIKEGHTPDNFTYNTAIATFCRAGMVIEAAALLEFMKTNGSTMSSPTARTYATMIVAYVENDRMDECFKLIADMISSGSVPDVSTYKEMIEGMCMAGKTEEAYRFLEEMGSKGYPPDVVTYNCFMKVLCDNKKSNEALHLYERMIKTNCEPSVHTYNMLMLMYYNMDDPEGALETWHEMDKRCCLRDTTTYCVMIEGLFGCNKVEDACLLLDEILDKEIKLPYQQFDYFLMQLSVIGNLKAIHKLSDHMRKFYNPAMARRFALSQKKMSMGLRGK